jgi:hypothetical protein
VFTARYGLCLIPKLYVLCPNIIPDSGMFSALDAVTSRRADYSIKDGGSNARTVVVISV